VHEDIESAVADLTPQSAIAARGSEALVEDDELNAREAFEELVLQAPHAPGDGCPWPGCLDAADDRDDVGDVSKGREPEHEQASGRFRQREGGTVHAFIR
jgi:hypothetical protein